MERTQIYLSTEQAEALDREARRRGTTRSHLIREAIEDAYAIDPDRERVLARLQEAAGGWRGRRESGEAYVERLRGTGRMARLSGARSNGKSARKRVDPPSG